MIKININGQRYSIKTDWNELTTAEVDNVSAIKAPELFREAVLTGEVGEFGEEHIKEMDSFYRENLTMFSDIPKAIIYDLDIGYIKAVHNSIEDIVIELITMDFTAEVIGAWDYFKGFGVVRRFDDLDGQRYTISQVAEAQDVLTKSGVQGMKYLPMIYNGWSERKMLKHKKPFAFRLAIDFFFDMLQWLKNLKRLFRKHSEDQPERRKNTLSQEQACEAPSTNYRRRDMLHFLN